MKKTTRILIFIYLAAVAGLASAIYIVPSVTGALTQTELLQYGNLRETDEAVCYFVREEEVYLAGVSGTINYYIGNDVKVRKNAAILSVAGGGAEATEESNYAALITKLGAEASVQADYKSLFNGIVSYYIDGYEGYFTPENLLALDYEEVRKLPIDTPVNLTRTSTYKNEPLYKICANDQWYITCWVSDGSMTKYQKGNSVQLELPMGDVKATVTEIADCGDVWQIVFKSNRHYEDFTKLRKAEVNIVTSDYSGIIVPNKSIAVAEGEVGVYVKSKAGNFEFVPIKIITSDGESSVVYDSYYYDEEGNKVNTVEIYDEILKNPEK